MKLMEHQAKSLLAERGLATPAGHLARSPEEAAEAARQLGGGTVAIKAQVRSGGRGKAGGIEVVAGPDAAAEAAGRILAMELAGEPVETVLVEQGVDIAAEHYVSVSIDPSSGWPMLMRSDQGGVEIESMADSIDRTIIRPGFETDDALIETLLRVFTESDATLVEINPLAVTTGGDTIALDAKIELDDSARFRHVELFERFETEARDHDENAPGTDRERKAAELGLRLIELGGDIAILANGAGLTMASMDAVVNAGGRPANFLEIGGDAYTKAVPALELVLSQPGVRSLLVNFCGAFARCDVMTAGVVEAWEALTPDIPINFSIAGTGQDEAKAMVRDRLGIEPHESMEAAVAAAVAGEIAGENGVGR